MVSISVEQGVSLGVMVPAVVLLMVSLSGTYWFEAWLQQGSKGSMIHVGLWKICGPMVDGGCESWNGLPGWIIGPEVLECLSLPCALAAVALSVWMLFHKTRLICLLAASLACLAGVLSLAGCLVFYSHVEEDSVPAWSFHLNVLANILCLLGGAALYLHLALMVRGVRS